MSTVLMTGFEPFAGDQSNPSGDAVVRLAAAWTGPARLVTAILPVDFTRASALLIELVAANRPDVVIATGLAGGRDAITPERIAVNLRDARIPDNAGHQPVDAPSIPGAPLAYTSSLPVKAIAHDIAANGIPASVSLSAGSFVCNDVFFTLAHLSANTPGLRAGFIHVPWDAESAPPGAASLPRADITRALEIAVRTTLTHTSDLDIPGGHLA
ncbi:pyroglutamyl-peptidase I [Microbacterium schleiferi]|uniref:Pyroglutamyl-peptidase I n=1 Tax=Microbacterium schleiferi TaxID=69362 RepID=A0ABU7V3A9_9MICO|nr:pyroglutamyl-peptidase I [Micrococcales bacterium]